jgi:hypothetical protein
MSALPTSSSNPPANAVASQAPIMETPPEPVALHGLRAWVSQPVVASFASGGLAGAVSRTVVSPLERLKILLQVQSGGHSEYKMSIWKALQKIWREEGFKGLMAGNGTNCIRIVPYSAVQFGSYNIYKPLVSIDLLQSGVVNWRELIKSIIDLRTDPRRTPLPWSATMLWCPCRHNLRNSHLPSRHRPDSSLHSVSVFSKARSQERGEEASRYVADNDYHVQIGRRLLRALPRYHSNCSWRRTLRRLELYDLRERAAILYAGRPLQPFVHRQALRRSDIRRCCADVHISARCAA